MGRCSPSHLFVVHASAITRNFRPGSRTSHPESFGQRPSRWFGPNLQHRPPSLRCGSFTVTANGCTVEARRQQTAGTIVREPHQPSGLPARRSCPRAAPMVPDSPGDGERMWDDPPSRSPIRPGMGKECGTIPRPRQIGVGGGGSVPVPGQIGRPPILGPIGRIIGRAVGRRCG
jgi:hypothetical protein